MQQSHLLAAKSAGHLVLFIVLEKNLYVTIKVAFKATGDFRQGCIVSSARISGQMIAKTSATSWLMMHCKVHQALAQCNVWDLEKLKSESCTK